MERTGQGRWTRQDSAAYYMVEQWGAPFFSVNARGHLAFTPPAEVDGRPRADQQDAAAAPVPAATIDLRALVDDLCRRGIQAPLLLRFNDILAARVGLLAGCFHKSMADYGYGGSYRGVMPIKVNQQRHVVEQLVHHGHASALGLEAGSKPELLVAIAMLEGSDQGLLICNGYKDAEYVETALYAQWLGLKPYIVLDRFAELQLVLDAAKKTGVRPYIGVRAKLSARGSGRWKDSSGDRSKFGLSAGEMLAALDRLEKEGMADCLRLLHFHMGSQITAIRAVKDALREAAHIYTGLREAGAQALDTIDCGGGLAVDYDGSRSNFHSSMNYTTQEYANDVVSTLQDICDKKGHPHPTIVTESGRALVAQHSVLVFNVLGVGSFLDNVPSAQALAGLKEGHEVLRRMYEAFSQVQASNVQEIYNDIVTLKEEVETLFSLGVINLKIRAHADNLFWATCSKVRHIVATLTHVPEDLKKLTKTLADTFYCNFSVFQSLPDSWAIEHLFPIVPLHRLDEEPTRHAVLADLTCDSDGKVDKFIDLEDVRDTLRLHAPNGRAYYLGAFLVGAYQEILGDLHNLFGDTNAVHVSLQADGTYTLDHVVEGDTVADVLGYVEYERAELLRRVRKAAERAVQAGRFGPEQFAQFIKRYEAGLAGYTYLEDFD